MKKVLHLVSSLNTGGAEKFVLNLSAQQKNEGIYVEILSFGKPNDSFQPLIENNGIKVTNVTGNLLVRMRKILTLLKKFDVVHIHSPAVIRALLPIYFLLKSYNVVYTIHGEVDPPQSLLTLSHQKALSYLKGISAVSLPAKESVTQRYGWKTNNIIVINNGVKVCDDQLKQNEKNDSIIHLGIASRLIPLKNIPLLFKAIKSLPQEKASRLSISIFGDGPERNNLNQLSDSLSPNVNTTFFGNVVNEQDIYSNIDILALCSISEGLPMSILEAMGYQVPVISSSVGAIPNVIEHKKSGWLFESESHIELSKILEDIIDDPKVIKIAGNAAKEFVSNHYSIGQTSAAFSLLYSSNSKVENNG